MLCTISCIVVLVGFNIWVLLYASEALAGCGINVNCSQGGACQCSCVYNPCSCYGENPEGGEGCWCDCPWYEGDSKCFCPGSCFLAGTLVNTKDGLTPIEQLKVGNQVLSLQGKVLRYNSVLFTYQGIQPSYFVINGTIKVTGSHPFLVNGKWTRVENIKPGDKLLSKDLKPVVVESVVRVNKPVRVFNFEVENAHNYFVQGVLVHNNKQP